MNRRLILLLTCLVSATYQAKSQSGSFAATSWWVSDTSVTPIDTEMHQPQQFYCVSIPYQDLGNYGTPVQRLSLPALSTAQFQTDHGNYAAFRYPTSQIGQFYRTDKPLADVRFAQGSKRFLQFNLLFLLPVKPNWQIGVDIHRVGSVGFYLRQNNDFYATRVFQSFWNKKKTYSLFAEAIFDKGQNEESGGLKNDSLFDALPYRDRILPVNLGSSQAKNEVKSNRFILRQGFKTSASSRITWFYDLLLEQTRWRYSDVFSQPDSGFYTYRLAPDTTRDSVFIRNMSQQLGVVTAYGFRGSLRFDALQLQDADPRRNYASLWVDAGYSSDRLLALGNAPGRLLAPKIQASIGLAGYHAGNYNVQVFSPEDTGSGFRYRVFSSRLSPNLLDVHFSGNHFFWQNTFVPVHQHGLSVSYKMQPSPWFSPLIKSEVQWLNHWIYGAQSGYPTQHQGGILAASVMLQQHWKWGHWHAEIQGNYTYTSASDIMPLPGWWTFGRLYWSGNYLGSPMKINVGIQGWYVAPYKAMAWEPSTRRYIIQNQVQTQGYPMLDAFLAGQIRSVTLFVKLEHGLAGALTQPYFVTPNYPMAGRTFRLGLRWRFFG